MCFWKLICFALAITSAAPAADLPFIGKWKTDPARSDLTGTTVSFESLPTGEWQWSSGGMTYKFRMDGEDHATGMGDTAAWIVLDRSTWQTTWKSQGKVLSTETLKLEPDGKTLTITNRGTTPNGKPINDSTTFQRQQGGPGLPGRWKSSAVKSDSAPVIEFDPLGEDGVVFKQPDWGVLCEAKLDGKDYPCTTPLGPGWTLAMTKVGERVLAMTVRKDGKAFVTMTQTVSGDGKTMTEVSEATGTNERTKTVYNRQ